jgi:hypothetical protein
MDTTMNEIPKAVRTPAEVVEQGTAPAFNVDQEYTFSMRSFRYRNQWAFCTVTYKGEALEILIGAAPDYPLPAMLQAKQFGGNVYGTFKGYHSHNGVDYPRFWNVSVG